MVRPVELQDALSKTQAVEKISQTQKANPENEQRNAIVTEERKSQDNQRRTVQTTHGDEVILHRECQHEEKKKNDKDKNKASGQDAGETQENSQESVPGTTGDSDDHPTPPPILDIHV